MFEKEEDAIYNAIETLLSAKTEREQELVADKVKTATREYWNTGLVLGLIAGSIIGAGMVGGIWIARIVGVI